MVRRGVRRADPTAAARMAGDRPRRVDAHPRADRQRQDARGVSLVSQPPHVRAAASARRSGAACSTSRRSRRSPSTSNATFARRSPASPNVARARGIPSPCRRSAIRTGDTPAIERARFGREAADILITTPESLFLLLTSNARERLASVDTVIIDEIHALVPGKRGAHLALSLERLEEIRTVGAGLTTRPSPGCSASAFPPRSVHSTRSRAFSAVRSRAPMQQGAVLHETIVIAQARRAGGRGNRERTA